MNMFRGEVERVWARKFTELGWPKSAAEKIAKSICSKSDQLSDWDGLQPRRHSYEEGDMLDR